MNCNLDFFITFIFCQLNIVWRIPSCCSYCFLLHTCASLATVWQLPSFLAPQLALLDMQWKSNNESIVAVVIFWLVIELHVRNECKNNCQSTQLSCRYIYTSIGCPFLPCSNYFSAVSFNRSSRNIAAAPLGSI